MTWPDRSALGSYVYDTMNEDDDIVFMGVWLYDAASEDGETIIYGRAAGVVQQVDTLWWSHLRDYRLPIAKVWIRYL